MEIKNITNISCKDIADFTTDKIKEVGFEEDSKRQESEEGQPHQHLRNRLRIKAVAELGDEQLLDKVIKQKV